MNLSLFIYASGCSLVVTGRALGPWRRQAAQLLPCSTRTGHRQCNDNASPGQDAAELTAAVQSSCPSVWAAPILPHAPTLNPLCPPQVRCLSRTQVCGMSFITNWRQSVKKNNSKKWVEERTAKSCFCRYLPLLIVGTRALLWWHIMFCRENKSLCYLFFFTSHNTQRVVPIQGRAHLDLGF